MTEEEKAKADYATAFLNTALLLTWAGRRVPGWKEVRADLAQALETETAAAIELAKYSVIAPTKKPDMPAPGREPDMPNQLDLWS